MVLVPIVNNLTSKSVGVMRLMRVISLHCLEHNIVFQACHVPGIENELADALSCQHINRFRELAPEAQARPELLPQEV